MEVNQVVRPRPKVVAATLSTGLCLKKLNTLTLKSERNNNLDAIISEISYYNQKFNKICES